MPGRRRWWLAGLQLLLAVAVAYFVWRALRTNWGELTRIGPALRLRPGPLLGAGAVVLVAYALLIEAWRRLIVAWRQRLPWRAATRIWTLSNLGRYLPGKVWAVVGLAALAEQAGISGWVAAGAALTMQVLSVGTGAATAAGGAPGAASPFWLGAAVGAAVLTVGALASPRVVRRLGRAVPGVDPARLGAPRVVSLLGASAATLGAWAAYGVALWLLAHGVLASPDGLTVWRATGSFAAAYVVGLVALFAPGGVGVREGVLIVLLEPSVGAAGAIALSLASRILLTATELIAAAVGWLLPRETEDHR